MDIQTRLKEFLSLKRLTFKDFEIQAGLANAAAARISENSRSSTFDRISIAFPELDIDWLRTGEGEMLKTLQQGESPALETPSTDVSSSKSHWIPLIPTSAHGGSLNDFVVSIKNSDCEKVLSPIRGADFAIPVTGDSMAPEYPNGSQVHIKKIDETAFIEWGKVYVLDTCNGTVIKRVVPSENEGCIRCVSINPLPDYAPFDVRMNDIFGMYRVVLCLSIK